MKHGSIMGPSDVAQRYRSRNGMDTAMTDWRASAAGFPAPTFPIEIWWDQSEEKWKKRPLTPNGHLDARLGGCDGLWGKANGFGIRMGQGLFALDVDSYKEASEAKEWLRQWRIDPKRTRAHKTVSGGAHLIFRTGEEFYDLRGGTNIVHGLDTRGEGGWIAFAQGYSVEQDVEPAYLNPDVLKHLRAISENRRTSGRANVGTFSPPPIEQQEMVLRRLVRVVNNTPALMRRWNGDTTGLNDTSRSAMDLSVAQMLGMRGFTADEIAWVLLAVFEHGQARYLMKGNERAAMRCASVAIAAQERREMLMRRKPEPDPDTAKMVEKLRAEGRL